MTSRAQPAVHRGLRAWTPWLGAGLVVAAAVAVALDRTVFSGRTHAATTSSAPADVRDGVRGLVTGSIPGAILFVRQGDRSYTVTAGYADRVKKTPMRAGDVFPIGSTTKTYTAVLVMRLVEQGKVVLDDPVSRYLPGLLPDGGRITIRELLSHTSGLYDVAQDPQFMAPYLRGNLGFAWTPRQLVGFAVDHPLLFAPGTRFAYSNTNYIVLALIAERVAGKSYERQLRDYVVRPLELNHTSLPAGNATLPDVHGYLSLQTYARNASPAPFDSAALTPSFAWSAGGIRATAEDVADFYRGLFSGKLLPAVQMAAMKDTSRSSGAYGLGLMPTDAEGYEWGSYTKAINATCGRAWGHGGSFPGYYLLPISSADGSRQAVLLVNADATLMQKQLNQVYAVLDTAYCRGVMS